VSEDETPADRLSAHGERHSDYRDALAEYCRSYTWSEIMHHMEQTGIAICPVCTPDEAVALPHVAARHVINQIDHPIEGRIPHLVNPLARGGLARRSHRPAPGLGEHAEEILLALGYSKDQVSELRQKKTI
jgi:crotonobetainyl-CoA:carnitine CoA-transferase CaiB-like acyl-CoA transferase